jgi:putative hydrolase of the HAD superfamily
VENPAAARSPVEAVLLDAYGTLLDLPDPVPLLRASLAAAGHPHPPGRVREALRGEIAFYRRHHDRGRDPASLAALREECAGVLAQGLGGDAPPPERLAPILVDSLRFALFPDALPALDALRAAGVRLAVVSNWDCSLAGVLEELGVGDRVEVVAASAVVGASKPDPAIFAHALSALGVAPGCALHCGDLPDKDCAGARAAGVRAVLLDRRGVHPPGPCPVVRSLLALARWTSG